VRVFLQDLPRVLDEHRTEQMTAGDFFGEIAALSRMAAHPRFLPTATTRNCWKSAGRVCAT
jgi:hypothetical protein